MYHPVQMNYLSAGFVARHCDSWQPSCRGLYAASIIKCENIFKTCEAMFLKTVDLIAKQLSEVKKSIFLTWNRHILFTQL